MLPSSCFRLSMSLVAWAVFEASAPVCTADEPGRIVHPILKRAATPPESAGAAVRRLKGGIEVGAFCRQGDEALAAIAQNVAHFPALFRIGIGDHLSSEGTISMHVRRLIQFGALGLVFTAVAIRADEATKKEREGLRPGDIEVRLNGPLAVAWKEVDGTNGGDRKVVFAAVKAGGTHIRLDWNDCPVIHAELAADHLGSAIASAVNAEIVGRLEFTATDELPGIPPPGLPGIAESDDALSPVVLVEALHIRVEPHVPSRDRNPVKSTTVGITKKH